MIDYNKLLEFFKKSKISGFIHHVREKIITTLHRECDLHLISLSEATNRGYRNCYILEGAELYYISLDRQISKDIILNNVLFQEQIEALKNAEIAKTGKNPVKLHLSVQQFQALITLNGGHSFRGLSPNDRLAAFFENMNDDGGCRLIRMSTDPTLSSKDAIVAVTQGKEALILFNDTLFYTDKMEVKKLKGTSSKPIDIEAWKTKFTGTNKLADEEELKLIKSVTGLTYEGIPPFIDFETDPEQISPIKKLFNALYYAELTFKELETTDLYTWNEGIPRLWQKTINHAYEASYLLTHLDIDLGGFFNQELAQVVYWLELFNEISKNNSDYIKELTESIQEYPLSYKAGMASGIAIDKMHPSGGDPDYDFLTNFGAVLPSYIDKLTGYIKQYTLQIKEHAPNLNRQQLEDLEKEGLKLLNSIELTNGLSTLDIINYISIVGHIITLSKSSLEQIGHLSEASQDAIRGNLTTLKYTLLPNLFSLIDKIEEQTMLQPGTLSLPLKGRVNAFYDELINYAKCFVNFEAKGKALLTLEDSRYIDLCLEPIYCRIDEANRALANIHLAREALKKFLLILKKPQYSALRLVNLPEATKGRLGRLHTIFAPYLVQMDANLNDTFIESLTTSEAPVTGASSAWIWTMSSREDSVTANVVKLDERLHAYLEKNEVSQKFYIDLRKDIIESAYHKTEDDTCLHPYSRLSNLFTVSESEILMRSGWDIHLKSIPDTVKEGYTNCYIWDGRELSYRLSNGTIQKNILTSNSLFQEKIDNIKRLESIKKGKEVTRLQLSIDQIEALITLNGDHTPLTSEQALNLHQYYQNKRTDLITAEQAYLKFMGLINEAYPIGSPVVEEKIDFEDDTIRRPGTGSWDSMGRRINKADCRELYKHFQPYLISAYQMNLEISDFDKAVVSLFTDNVSPDLEQISLPVTAREFHLKELALLTAFQTNNQAWENRSAYYLSQVETLRRKEIKAKKLTKQNPREHYILKHKHYSQVIAKFRASLYEMTEWFNDSVRSTLISSEYGVPFPEMENRDGAFAESSQVLALKRLFNSIYHFEKIFLELESLDTRSFKTVYVRHLIAVHEHIRVIVSLAKKLDSDPYFSIIAQEIIHKAQNLYKITSEHATPYFTGSELLEPIQKSVIYPGLWYTLDVFMLLPEHIIALTKKCNLSENQINTLQTNAKKTVISIENIINNSNSYVALFFQIPTIYNLFNELKRKLALFTSTTHKTVKNNLNEINTILFTKIQLEADAWEDKLGLKPGIVSATTKAIFDEYYKGLVAPLRLDFKTQVRLVCNSEPIKQRKKAVGKRRLEAMLEKEKLRPSLAKIERLVNLIANYHPSKSYVNAHELKIAYVKALPFLTNFQQYYNSEKCGLIKLLKDPTTMSVEDLKELLNDMPVYALFNSKIYYINRECNLKKLTIIKPNENRDAIKAIFPERDNILEKASQKKLTEITSCTGHTQIETSEDPNLDNLLTLGLDNPASKLVNIRVLSTRCKHYLQGIMATHQLTIASANEKIVFLKNLKKTQAGLNEQYKIEYAQQYFTKQVENFCNRPLGLFDVEKEYNEKLKENLLLYESDILNEVRGSKDIDVKINEFLKRKVKTFETKNIKSYYQLDAIIGQIDQFKRYLKDANQAIKDKHSRFENSRTVREKKHLIVQLKNFSDRKDLSINERYKEIQKIVERSSFEKTMLSYHAEDTFNYTWVIQWIAWLQRMLYLYTPPRQIHCQNLQHAVKTEPNMSQLTKRFCLFYDKDKPRNPDAIESVTSDDPCSLRSEI